MSGLPPGSWAGGVTGGAGVWASAEAGHRATKATRIGSARLAKRRRVAAFVGGAGAETRAPKARGFGGRRGPKGGRVGAWVDAVWRLISIATVRRAAPRGLRQEPPFRAHPGLGIARRTRGRRLVGE